MKGASTVVTATVNAPRALFYYWFLSVDPAKILRRYAILPSIAAARNQTGPLYLPGTTREFLFSDGTTAFEEILGSDPPSRVDYRVGRLTSMFRHLIREGRAQITFREQPQGGTHVEWRYTFYGRNRAASLLLRPMVAVLWRGFIRAALLRAKRLAESELSKHPG